MVVAANNSSNTEDDEDDEERSTPLPKGFLASFMTKTMEKFTELDNAVHALATSSARNPAPQSRNEPPAEPEEMYNTFADFASQIANLDLMAILQRYAQYNPEQPTASNVPGIPPLRGTPSTLLLKKKVAQVFLLFRYS